jgi:hypothetical protein
MLGIAVNSSERERTQLRTLPVAEGKNYIEVAGTTSVKGNPRRVCLTRGQPGRVVITVYIGRKPIDVVLPIPELRERLNELERQ